jgi:hypothetical protein
VITELGRRWRDEASDLLSFYVLDGGGAVHCNVKAAQLKLSGELQEQRLDWRYFASFLFAKLAKHGKGVVDVLRELEE